MATEIGHASLGIIPSFKGFDSNLERGISGPMGSVGKSAGSKFSSAFASAAKVGIVGVLGAGALAVKVGKDSIEAASTLNESLNAVNLTYEKQAKAVKRLGEQSAESLGLSNAEFNGLAVQFSAFATTVAGGAGPKVVRVLDDLTTRSADFASVMNLEVNEATALFQSGLAGETEPLRKFGIDLSAAAVEAHGLSMGMSIASEGMTEQQKILARYDLLMKQTSKTQGDFANTSDSLANRQRILNASWENAKAKLGTALLPLMGDLVGLILDKGIPAFERFSDWFADEGIDGLKEFGAFTRDEILPVVKDLGEFLADAAAFGGDMVKVFNKLPSDAKLAALGAVLGGGAYMKLRGGGGGALGSAGSALGLAKPTPVFVTNWAQIGAAGGGGGVVAADGGKSKTRGGGLARGAGVTIAAALAFAFGDDAADAYMDGFERNSKWATRIGRSFESSLGGTVKTALEAGAKDVTQYARGFDKIPETLQSRFQLLGIPETERELRNIMRVYDIAAKDRQTTLELLGYDPLLDKIRNVTRELDWAARPRQARIDVAVAYSNAGYQTTGGLVEGDGSNYSNAHKRMGD